MKKSLFVYAFLLGALFSVSAQVSADSPSATQWNTNFTSQTAYWTVNWNIGIPMGETNDYISKTSFRGISLDGRYFLTDEISIGGVASWQVFNERLRNLPPQPIEDQDGVQGDISGSQYRYLNAVPIMANAHYYTDLGSTTAYFGTGIGTMYSEQRTELGLNAFVDESWGFAFQPEVGVFIPIGWGDAGLNVAVRYLYGTASGDQDNVSALTFAVGFGWLY